MRQRIGLSVTFNYEATGGGRIAMIDARSMGSDSIDKT